LPSSITLLLSSTKFLSLICCFKKSCAVIIGDIFFVFSKASLVTLTQVLQAQGKTNHSNTNQDFSTNL
jgi:hypothetical protein